MCPPNAPSWDKNPSQQALTALEIEGSTALLTVFYRVQGMFIIPFGSVHKLSRGLWELIHICTANNMCTDPLSITLPQEHYKSLPLSGRENRRDMGSNNIVILIDGRGK